MRLLAFSDSGNQSWALLAENSVTHSTDMNQWAAKFVFVVVRPGRPGGAFNTDSARFLVRGPEALVADTIFLI